MRVVACCVAAAALLGVGLAHAQVGELEALLDEAVVSTPSKSSETVRSAPATTSVITAEELRTYGLRTLAEAINFAALGMVTTETEHAVEIGARGVLLNGDYGNHVLLLVDGVPANEPWAGTALFERGAGVPIEMVDHIEVTLGPGSVMHGGQAMLGVVNVVTKRAADFDGVRFIVEGDTAAPVSEGGRVTLTPLRGYGAGYRAGIGVGREFTLIQLPAELTLQFDYYRHDGPDWEFGSQPWGEDSITGEPRDFGPRATPGIWGGTATRSNYTEVPELYARMRVGELTASIRAGSYTRASPYPDALVSGGGDDFDDPDNHERDRWLGIGLGYRATLSSRVGLSVLGYGLVNDYTWFSRRSAAEECPEGFERGCERALLGSGLSGGGDVRVTVDVPEIAGTTLVGLDARLRRASSDYDVIDLATGEVDVVGNDYAQNDALIAPYAQQSFVLHPDLDLNLGARLDNDTRFGSELSPRAALGWNPWRAGRLKAIYSEAFRAPSAYELNYEDPLEQVRTPELGPESVRSLELLLTQRLGMHQLSFGVFRSSWQDMVGYRTLGDAEVQAFIDTRELDPSTTEAYAYANAGSLRSFGYNAAYDGTLGRFRLGANLTSAFSRIDLGDGAGALPLTVGPTWFGNARVSYHPEGSWPVVALASSVVNARPADRAFDGGFAAPPEAPPDVQLRLTFSGAVPSVDALSYRLSTSYRTAPVGPYVIGPYQYAADESTVATLSPQRRVTAFAGLEYLFD